MASESIPVTQFGHELERPTTNTRRGAFLDVQGRTLGEKPSTHVTSLGTVRPCRHDSCFDGVAKQSIKEGHDAIK